MLQSIYIVITILLCGYHRASSASPPCNNSSLPFLVLGGKGVLSLPPVDDGSYPVNLPQPLPLGLAGNTTSYTTAYVSTNGIISFNHPLLNYFPEKFPLDTHALVAIYWTDIDLSGGVGSVRYAVYTAENGSHYIDQVNKFLDSRAAQFVATMMLVVQWMDVCPIHDYLCNETKGNSFQAVIATDGKLSYTIFTYLCGKLNWLGYSRSGIGFDVPPNFFANSQFSLTPNVNNVACAGACKGASLWSNIVYCTGGCTDICEAADPCKNGGTCIGAPGDPSSFTCNCSGTGYTGKMCEDPAIYVYIEHNSVAADDGSVIFERGEEVTLNCRTMHDLDNSAVIQWTSTASSSFKGTGASIVVDKKATYTCIIGGNSDLRSSIVVKEKQCVMDLRSCKLVAKYRLCHYSVYKTCCHDMCLKPGNKF